MVEILNGFFLGLGAMTVIGAGVVLGCFLGEVVYRMVFGGEDE